MNVKKYVRALLCLYLTLIIAMDAVKAQTLKVGDTLPLELWSMPLQVVNHAQGKETLTLSEYKDKLIILDFWATWCAPCIKSLTKLDTLQKEFGEQLAVIPITYEAADKVLPMFQKRGWSLPSVINDSTLKKYFPHRSIPHQVWVRAGEVLAVTGAEYATRENITSAINGNPLQIRSKSEDMSFDKTAMVQRLENGFIESSIKERVNIENSAFEVSSYGIIYYNASLFYLLRESLALTAPFVRLDNRLLFEMPDTLVQKITPVFNGTVNEEVNKYTYHSRSAFSRSVPEIYSKMRDDLIYYLDQALGIHVSIESRVMDCVVLRLRDKSKLSCVPEGAFSYEVNNRPFSHFVYVLNWENRKQPLPVLDETGIEGVVHIKLNTLNDLNKVGKELAEYGIELVTEPRETSVVVFKPVKADRL